MLLRCSTISIGNYRSPCHRKWRQWRLLPRWAPPGSCRYRGSLLQSDQLQCNWQWNPWNPNPACTLFRQRVPFVWWLPSGIGLSDANLSYGNSGRLPSLLAISLWEVTLDGGFSQPASTISVRSWVLVAARTSYWSNTQPTGDQPCSDVVNEQSRWRASMYSVVRFW